MADELKLDKDKKYRIRQWDDMMEEYGLDRRGNINMPAYWFSPEMRHLCGNIVSQVDIDEGIGCWTIINEMLEVIKDEVEDVEINTTSNNKTRLLPFMEAFKIAVESDKKIKHSSMLSPVEWLEFFWDYSKDEIIEMKKSDEWEVF